MMNLRKNVGILFILMWFMQAANARDYVETRDANIEDLALEQDLPLRAGRKAVAANDWQTAIMLFQKAVLQEPNNPDGFNLLAYSYRKQAKPDIEKAFENYRMALKLDPKHKGAHEYIGEAYLMVKQPAEAEKHLALLASICGNKTCEEYEDLAKAIAEYNKK